MNHDEAKGLSIGYFGASTGAASALRAAAYFGDTIKAVVSRGGRPDLALSALSGNSSNIINCGRHGYASNRNE
jgi:hypothetical protein